MSDFNDSFVPFLWFGIVFLSFLTPFVALLSWGHILYVLRSKWLGFLTVVVTAYAASNMRTPSSDILLFHPVFWCLLLFTIVINRSLIRQVRADKRIIYIVNTVAAISLMTLIWLPVQGWDVLAWDVYSPTTYTFTSMLLFLTIVLIIVTCLYPLNLQGKSKSGYRRDNTWLFVAATILFSIFVGFYIYENRYSFICTSLGVMFPPLLLRTLHRNP